MWTVSRLPHKNTVGCSVCYWPHHPPSVHGFKNMGASAIFKVVNCFFKKKLFTVVISRPADRLYLTKQVDSLNCHAVNWVHILYYTVTIIPCVCAWYSQLCRNRTVCGFNGCSLTCTPILHVLNITCFPHLPHTEYWISITFSTSKSCILWPYIPGYFWCCILSACDYCVITRNLDFRVVYYKCKLWI